MKKDHQTQFFSKELFNISKENKNLLFLVSCFNHCDNNYYYLMNGQICQRITEVPNYDLFHHKIKFSDLKKEAIYTLKDVTKNYYLNR